MKSSGSCLLVALAAQRHGTVLHPCQLEEQNREHGMLCSAWDSVASVLRTHLINGREIVRASCSQPPTPNRMRMVCSCRNALGDSEEVPPASARV